MVNLMFAVCAQSGMMTSNRFPSSYRHYKKEQTPNKQTNKQTSKQTNKQTNKQTRSKQTDNQQANQPTNKQTCKQTNNQTNTHTQRHTNSPAGGWRCREHVLQHQTLRGSAGRGSRALGATVPACSQSRKCQSIDG